MQTLYEDTRGKVRSIFPSLVWHATDKKKKRSNTKFETKSILSALSEMKAQKTTTVMDPVLKTVYGTMQLGLADNRYNKLTHDEDTNPTVYKNIMVMR